MTTAQSDLYGKRVLVTGGTGFIGGRLVERLVLEHSAEVRVLVRSFSRVPRIARFPIEMVRGDVTEPQEVERAAYGCQVVFHCAAIGGGGDKEMMRLVNVEGTRNVMKAALHAEAERVVHLSSLTVYGNRPDGDLDEDSPRRYGGYSYGDTKLEAERVAFEYIERRGLPVTVLQPAAVYGPFGGYWTTHTLQRLKTECVILVNGGEGFSNAVYVDDVVSAMLLSAVKDEAAGEAFLISSDQTVTWQEFFNRYARMVGNVAMVSMSADEALKYYRAWGRRKRRGVLRETVSILQEQPAIRRRLLRTPQIALLLKIVRPLVPERIRQSPKKTHQEQSWSAPTTGRTSRKKANTPNEPPDVKFYAGRTRIRIDKAKRVLGYRPAFDFGSGMQLTEQWARWAGLP